MKIKVFIHAKWDEWDKEYRFYPWGQDMSSSSNEVGPLVGTHEFDFDAPPHEVLVNGTIESFRKVRAEAELRCNQIQEQINTLLCIEHKPEPA